MSKFLDLDGLGYFAEKIKEDIDNIITGNKVEYPTTYITDTTLANINYNATTIGQASNISGYSGWVVVTT